MSNACERLRAYNDPSVFIKTYSAIKTQQDAIVLQKQGEPSLCAYKRKGDKVFKQILATLAINIAAFDRFLHLKNPLSPDECDFIAEQIVDEFGTALTLADVYLVLKDAKAGKYGKFYERVSAPDIISWFREYFDKRLDAAYELNRQQDKSTYGGVSSATEKDQYANLARLGYGINPDGTIGPNKERIEQINAEREKKRQEQLEKDAERIKKDTDEALWMAQYREAEKNGTVKEFLESLK